MLVSTGLPCWGILGKSSAVWWIWETAHFRNLALRARRLGDAVVGLAPCAARAPGCAAANGPIRRRNTTLGSLVDDLTRTERTRWIGLRVLCLSVCDGEVVLSVVGPFVTVLRPNMTMMMGRFQGYINMDSIRDDNKKTSSKVASILSVVDGRIGRTKGWMDGWMDGWTPSSGTLPSAQASIHPSIHPSTKLRKTNRAFRPSPWMGALARPSPGHGFCRSSTGSETKQWRNKAIDD
jgi:hypothetical protein